MSFHFVDNNAANNPGTRRAIRRHVMKGKNLGRRIEGRGRRHAPLPADVSDSLNPVPKEPNITLLAKKDQYLDHGYFLFPELTEDPKHSMLFAGHEFDYFSYPTQFTPKMRYLIYQYHTAIFEMIYPYAFCRPSPDTKPPWLEYMVSDKAFLHCLLGMAATYHALFGKPGSETIEATQHFIRAFRLINDELSKGSIPTDSTLAVIITFAIHGALMHDFSQCRVHMRGVEGSLALRPGGLLSLRETNGDLMHKICRADVELALRVGSPTRFGLLGVVKSDFLGKHGHPLSYPLNLACPPLRAIAEEVMAFCKGAERTKVVGLDYQDLLTWMWQRLIDFAPLRGEKPQNPLDDVLHLGLLAFLSTVSFPHPFLMNSHTTMLGEMLSDRIESDPLSSMGRDYLPLRFWVAFMHGLISLDSNRCLASQIKSLAEELGILSWKGAMTTLRCLPWIDIAHMAPGKQLWESKILASKMVSEEHDMCHRSVH